jgi:hypothetical protein
MSVGATLPQILLASFQGNRLRNAAFAVMLFVTSGVAVWSVVDLRMSRQSEDLNSASQAAADQRQRNYAVASCPAEPAVELLFCVTNADAAYRDALRSQQELQAQKESARAAFWSVTIACLQTLLVALGFYVLFRSLETTRRSIELAGEANTAAIKALSLARQTSAQDRESSGR